MRDRGTRKLTAKDTLNQSGSSEVIVEFVKVLRKKSGQSLDRVIEITDMRQIARANYVVSRVSLVCGYSIAGCLLAHQSVEMYLKGLISAYGGKARTHNLRELVGKGARLGAQGLVELSRSRDHMTMLRQLCSVYDNLRFSEDAGYAIDHLNIVLLLDELAFTFEKMFAEKLGETNPLHVYVHESMKDRFLKNNAFFHAEVVTNNKRAMATTNEKEIPDLPVEKARTTFAVLNVQARGVSSPGITFLHVPKRKLPGEHRVKVIASTSDAATLLVGIENTASGTRGAKKD